MVGDAAIEGHYNRTARGKPERGGNFCKLLFMATTPSKSIETFPNPHPNNDYTIRFATDEFTTVCPLTGQPDFAQISVEYIPNQRCLESKSLKLYLWSFRNEGHFHEDVTNILLNDMVAACAPQQMTVTGHYNVRGGIDFVITARFQAEDSTAAQNYGLKVL
jgi:7-cyano-7-deazaguanine reductase